MKSPHRTRLVVAFIASGLAACSDATVTPTGGGGGSSGGGGGSSSGGGGGGAVSGSGGGISLPPIDGGVGGGAGSGASGGEGCGQLTAILRDFTPDHPDFESFSSGLFPGLVEDVLGSDGKPVYKPAGGTKASTGKAAFDQWYRDVPGVNMKFALPLPLTSDGNGTFMFSDANFFPLDGKGFGNFGMTGHNFHFTTEIHGTFKYKGGELFTFTGDDDVFVFVNNRLALDIGGVHGKASKSIEFDARKAELGITVGNTYPLDVFHAERHTSASNFRIETSIECLNPVIK